MDRVLSEWDRKDAERAKLRAQALEQGMAKFQKLVEDVKGPSTTTTTTTTSSGGGGTTPAASATGNVTHTAAATDAAATSNVGGPRTTDATTKTTAAQSEVEESEEDKQQKDGEGADKDMEVALGQEKTAARTYQKEPVKTTGEVKDSAVVAKNPAVSSSREQQNKPHGEIGVRGKNSFNDIPNVDESPIVEEKSTSLPLPENVGRRTQTTATFHLPLILWQRKRKHGLLSVTCRPHPPLVSCCEAGSISKKQKQQRLKRHLKRQIIVHPKTGKN